MEFTIVDVVRGVWNRRLLVTCVFMLTVFLVGVATILCPKSYTSDSTMFVRLGRENVGLDATATLGERSVLAIPLTREAEINSIAGMICRKSLLERVVDKVGAERILDREADGTSTDESPSFLSSAIDEIMATLKAYGVTNDLPSRERAVIKLQKKIGVDSIEKSNLVNVSFESYSPDVAQAVIYATTDAYVADHSKINRTSGAFSFLTSQTESVRSELAEAEDRLRELKSGTGILELEKQREVFVNRIARLEDELLQIDAQRAGLLTEVSDLEEKLASMSETKVIESRTGAGNEAADGMRQQLFAMEIAREKAKAGLTKQHPTLQQMDAQIASTQSRLTDEEALRQETLLGPNTVYEKTHAELIMKRASLAATESRRNVLSKQLDEAKEESNIFAKNEVDYARLSRQVAISDSNYRKYAQNLMQAKIDNEMEQNQLSNITIVQPATLNIKPSFPNKLINLALGLMLGMVNAVGLATLLEFRQRYLQAKEAREVLGLPVLARLPAMTNDQILPRRKRITRASGRDKTAVPTERAEIDADVYESSKSS